MVSRRRVTLHGMRAPPAVEPRSGLRSSRPRALPIGLALALALHALGLAAVAFLGRELAAAQRVARAQPAQGPAELADLEVELEVELQNEPAAALPAASTAPPGETALAMTAPRRASRRAAAAVAA